MLLSGKRQRSDRQRRQQKRLAGELNGDAQFFKKNLINAGRQYPERGRLGTDTGLTQQNAPRRRAWTEYAFEGLCLKHALQLKTALGIASVKTTEAPWRYQSSTNSNIPGAQIDLLIDRRDDTINLCKMKYFNMEFTIDKKYAKDLRRKLAIFRRVTGTRKNIFLTMVTMFGVTNNDYAKELVAIVRDT